MRAAAPGYWRPMGGSLRESDTAGLEVDCVDPFDGNRQQATAQTSGTNGDHVGDVGSAREPDFAHHAELATRRFHDAALTADEPVPSVGTLGRRVARDAPERPHGHQGRRATGKARSSSDKNPDGRLRGTAAPQKIDRDVQVNPCLTAQDQRVTGVIAGPYELPEAPAAHRIACGHLLGQRRCTHAAIPHRRPGEDVTHP
jgi:hypothetical protein